MRKVMLLTAIVLLTLMSAKVAYANGGGHLWFYSQDPDTLPGPQPLPDPQDYDPNYVGTNPDPWITESIVPTGDWHEFHLWLACAQFESLDTMLVVSINDAAEGVIDGITVNGIPLGPWDTSGVPPGCLAPHGVFNSAEFYGCAEVNVGDLYSPPGIPYVIEIVVDIQLSGPVPSEAKIHFDAYGLTANEDWIFSPYSHDFTFRIPEYFAGTILGLASSIAALAVFKHKRVNPKL
jgi:hypothetical protein